MCPSLIEIGSKTAEKNSAQANRQTNRHYENNGHLAVNQLSYVIATEHKSSRIVHLKWPCVHASTDRTIKLSGTIQPKWYTCTVYSAT